MQVVAVVGLNTVGVVAKVLLVCVEQEVLHHVRHLHFLKHRKEDAFAHTADPGATVQGTVCTGLTRTLVVEKRDKSIITVAKSNLIQRFIKRIKSVKYLKLKIVIIKLKQP